MQPQSFRPFSSGTGDETGTVNWTLKLEVEIVYGCVCVCVCFNLPIVDGQTHLSEMAKSPGLLLDRGGHKLNQHTHWKGPCHGLELQVGGDATAAPVVAAAARLQHNELKSLSSRVPLLSLLLLHSSFDLSVSEASLDALRNPLSLSSCLHTSHCLCCIQLSPIKEGNTWIPSTVLRIRRCLILLLFARLNSWIVVVVWPQTRRRRRLFELHEQRKQSLLPHNKVYSALTLLRSVINNYSYQLQLVC